MAESTGKRPQTRAGRSNEAASISSKDGASSAGFSAEPLGDRVAFATLRPKCSDASSQLVELMRATLRQAQEIGAAVGEAEDSAARAREAAAEADVYASDNERDRAEREIERISAAVLHAASGTGPASFAGNSSIGACHQVPIGGGPNAPASLAATAEMQSSPWPNAGGAHSAPLVAGSSSGLDLGEAGTTAPMPTLPGGGVPSVAAPVPSPIAAQMTQEIETTVMWVQQLLESVHFVESDTALDHPGASLLSIVQPRLRHQKDEALAKSLKLFNEKKEEEKEFDERAVFFRSQALEVVAQQRDRDQQVRTPYE